MSLYLIFLIFINICWFSFRKKRVNFDWQQILSSYGWLCNPYDQMLTLIHLILISSYRCDVYPQVMDSSYQVSILRKESFCMPFAIIEPILLSVWPSTKRDFSSFTLFNLKWKTIGGSLTRITWQENFFLLQFGLWTSCRMPRLAIDWYWWPNTGRGFQDGQFPWWSWPSTMINLLETKLLIGSWSEISSQLIPQKSGLVFLDLWWKINGNPNKRKSLIYCPSFPRNSCDSILFVQQITPDNAQ